MMYFRTVERAFKCRDFINMLFERQGLGPAVKVEKVLAGFRVVPIKPRTRGEQP